LASIFSFSPPAKELLREAVVEVIEIIFSYFLST